MTPVLSRLPHSLILSVVHLAVVVLTLFSLRQSDVRSCCQPDLLLLQEPRRFSLLEVSSRVACLCSHSFSLPLFTSIWDENGKGSLLGLTIRIRMGVFLNEHGTSLFFRRVFGQVVIACVSVQIRRRDRSLSTSSVQSDGITAAIVS